MNQLFIGRSNNNMTLGTRPSPALYEVYYIINWAKPYLGYLT